MCTSLPNASLFCIAVRASLRVRTIVVVIRAAKRDAVYTPCSSYTIGVLL